MMPADIELNVTPASLEELRCFYCHDYLSISPIYLLPNGNNMCALCSPLNGGKTFYRQLSLEAILCNAVFPCKFKKHGCNSRLLFNHITQHEAQCMYDIFDSFGMPSGGVKSAEKWVNPEDATQETTWFVEDVPELEQQSMELPAESLTKRKRRDYFIKRFKIKTGRKKCIWIKRKIPFALGIKKPPVVDPEISTTAPVEAK